MREREETYDDDRARQLQGLLRALAARIAEWDARGDLLAHAGDLMKMIGDIRSELFHYEVRATYDTPETAEHRRIVDDATAMHPDWERPLWQPEQDRDSDREW
jgi:hypothetical protein